MTIFGCVAGDTMSGEVQMRDNPVPWKASQVKWLPLQLLKATVACAEVAAL